MPKLSKQPFDLVKNKSYTLYKLRIDNVCPIDEFIKESEQSPLDESAVKTILSRIEHFTDTIRYPLTIFRPIKGTGRDDIFEFKVKRKGTNAVRFYVIKKRPDMLILLGGSKNSQDKDIRRITTLVRDINFI